jgi:membrane protease YdiL (CAAX protease family)
MELLWLTLGVGLMAELLVSRGWLGFPATGRVADLNAWQLMVLVLAQNLLAVLSIILFLRLEGRSLSYLGFGRGSLRRELGLGLLLFPPILVLAVGAEMAILRFLPALHDVEVNPFLALLEGPGSLAALLAGSVLGGGLGEETVRAFVLRRFQTHLGSLWVGLVVWSLVFGALHLEQGMDKALVVGLLGFAFGLLFVWRRSPVAAMVVHGAFNATQTLAAYFLMGN